MAQIKYRYIIPLFLTALTITGVIGIIGNALTLDQTTERNFGMDNIESDGYKYKLINLPNFEDREFEVKLNKETTVNSIVAEIILSEEEPSSASLTSLLTDTSFSSEIIDQESQVSDSATFFLSNSLPDSIYIIIGNPNLQTVSWDIQIEIKSTNLTNGVNTGKIFGIIFSSLFTLISLVLAAYTWFELIAVEWYTPRLLTDETELSFQRIADRAQNWEVFLMVAGTLLIPWGIGSWFLGSGNGALIFAIIILAFSYYSFNKRIRLEDSIRNVLPQYPKIKLDELSKMVDDDPEDTKKALLNLIMYENFPAKYDFESNTVIYSEEYRAGQVAKPVYEGGFYVPENEVTSQEINKDGADKITKKALPTCAYCGEEAIKTDVRFCHSCGASMTAAK